MLHGPIPSCYVLFFCWFVQQVNNPIFCLLIRFWASDDCVEPIAGGVGEMLGLSCETAIATFGGCDFDLVSTAAQYGVELEAGHTVGTECPCTCVGIYIINLYYNTIFWRFFDTVDRIVYTWAYHQNFWAKFWWVGVHIGIRYFKDFLESS